MSQNLKKPFHHCTSTLWGKKTCLKPYALEITNAFLQCYLRNIKRFPCSHKVKVTQVEVWENVTSCGVCFHSCFKFSQTFTSVTTPSWKLGKKVFFVLSNIHSENFLCLLRVTVNGSQPINVHTPACSFYNTVKFR